MKETLVHTICTKCDKDIDLIMTPEERKAMNNGTPVHCEDCFDKYLTELYNPKVEGRI